MGRRRSDAHHRITYHAIMPSRHHHAITTPHRTTPHHTAPHQSRQSNGLLSGAVTLIKAYVGWCALYHAVPFGAWVLFVANRHGQLLHQYLMGLTFVNARTNR